ncbi:unnamed protein product [Caenorhabditis angaria]|uniref:MOFRL-associated domain-containing protein n=1 Tax=Caenorhabditis angaria TaxID=860376 RepID=A0A9P1N209_9PELO|nr:unnamed protein product [Caenorhabditis angaria]
MRKLAENVFRKCLESVEPKMCVEKALQISANYLSITNSKLDKIPISNSTNFVVIGFGKAVVGMSKGIIEKLPKNQTQIHLIAPKNQQGAQNFGDNFEVNFAAPNNLPDEDSVFYTEKLLEKIDELDSPQTIFIFLISGGGSALFCSPIDGVKLAEKLEIIKILVKNGATIQQLNIVRQKLSKVKGGGLLKGIKKGKAISLIISDIIDNPLELIANPTAEAPNLVQFQNHIISSNSLALEAIYSNLPTNYSTQIITSSLSGNATEIGQEFARILRSRNANFGDVFGAKIPDLKFPMALIFGGETTVILKGDGKGGRNQEMVLACLNELQNQEIEYEFCFLSAGTDGQDGPTNAAGAIISNSDLLSEDLKTLPPSEFLANSDSWNFWRQFQQGKCHLITGPTGTNVMDIQILLIDRKQ